MNDNKAHLESLKDIKSMMERSSRFISLSGKSGIAAGICALIGAWFANDLVSSKGEYNSIGNIISRYDGYTTTLHEYMGEKLFTIAFFTFVAAFISAFFFTYLRSIKNRQPIWDVTAKRLMINVSVPIVVGGIFLLKMVWEGAYSFVAPGCLIFYGLALVNASKYTLSEVRYLGYGQLFLGLVSLWFTGYAMYFWAMGFGVLHIIYGFIMWVKYERKK
ncbi:MAG: hypothetical protein H7068_10540 [Pedobacter sp.]|nr:hypothetical protein [Chitinophagaceae bacterium]